MSQNLSFKADLKSWYHFVYGHHYKSKVCPHRHTELCIKLTTFMLTQIYTLRYTEIHTQQHTDTDTDAHSDTHPDTRNTQIHTDTHSGDLAALCVCVCVSLLLRWFWQWLNVSVWQQFLVLNSAVIKKVWCGSDGGSLVDDSLTKMTKAQANFFSVLPQQRSWWSADLFLWCAAFRVFPGKLAALNKRMF